MLKSLKNFTSPGSLDVQVWYCEPLLIVNDEAGVLYARSSQIEFTPLEPSAKAIGHAVALEPDAHGSRPEISVSMRQYIDNPIELGKRQGIILTGTDLTGTPVRWLINGAVDRFMTVPEEEAIEYDEETAKILENELKGQPDKINLNSYL